MSGGQGPLVSGWISTWAGNDLASISPFTGRDVFEKFLVLFKLKLWSNSKVKGQTWIMALFCFFYGCCFLGFYFGFRENQVMHVYLYLPTDSSSNKLLFSFEMVVFSHLNSCSNLRITQCGSIWCNTGILILNTILGNDILEKLTFKDNFTVLSTQNRKKVKLCF